MIRDLERMARVSEALAELRVDGLICALPANVLMLSGYCPVVGLSIALATRDGTTVLIVPEDEKSLAESSSADEVLAYTEGSLDDSKGSLDALRKPLVETVTRLSLFSGARFCTEGRSDYQPSTYAAMHLPGPTFCDFLREIFPQCEIVSAAEKLSELRARLTPDEITRVRAACNVAECAFLRGAKGLRAGLSEIDAANLFRAPLGLLEGGIQRADGFVYCMSGENSFEAFAAFQRSRSRNIEFGDLILVHCNSCADGFWTDITRTFCAGEPGELERRMYDAIFASREAAISTVQPGIKASEVDRAARETMTEHGFAKEFRHPTGHGVGFAAINHNAQPRIHARSQDVLQPGMVFNIEPGVYIEGVGGARHCDMVVVTESGAEVLTPFQCTSEELILRRNNVLAATADD